MKILIVSQWFEPEAHYKGLVFAKALRDRGHDIEVVTGFPNYPGGTLYPGYTIRPYQREVMDGITVHRAPLYPSHDGSSVKRALNYTTFAASSAIGTMLRTRPDVTYVYTPPATAALGPYALRKLRGVPYVLDIQDLWPDTLSATGMVNSPRLLAAIGGWTRLSFNGAARIAVLSPGFRDRLIARGIASDKIRVIPNWSYEPAPVTAPSPPPPDWPTRDGSFDVLFAGNMGLAQGLDTVIDAAKILHQRSVRARFVMIGSGLDLDRLARRAMEENVGNMIFLARRPAEAMAAAFDAADALLVHLRDDPLFAITIPSKTQSYLLAGKPILMGVRGDASNLVDQAGAGLSFTPDDPPALADAVERMISTGPAGRADMGRRGTAFYWDRLSFSKGVDAFEALLQEAALSARR